MANRQKVPRKIRLLISLSVLVALVGTTISIFGMPTVVSNQLARFPALDQIKIRPVTIFDPPKYSIDQADSLWVVVNKQRPISPLRYKPESPAFPAFPKPKIQNPYGLVLRQEAALATGQLASAMAEAGLGRLILHSGYRTYKNQQGLYNKIKDTQGLAVAEKLSARPGHSEHQLGLAADFSVKGETCVIMVCFGNTEAGKWLAENAYKSGFILRYPKGFKAVTGFQYEPWHFRFVGVELATEMNHKGIQTLEQFWELAAAPDYSDSL
jgi:D-alanyl-D-alanine carboxypeptidase